MSRVEKLNKISMKSNALYCTARPVQGAGRVRAFSINWAECQLRADMYTKRKELQLDITYPVALYLASRAIKYVKMLKMLADGTIEETRIDRIKALVSKEEVLIERYYGMTAQQWVEAFTIHGYRVLDRIANATNHSKPGIDCILNRIDELENMLFYDAVSDRIAVEIELDSLYKMLL